MNSVFILSLKLQFSVSGIYEDYVGNFAMKFLIIWNYNMFFETTSRWNVGITNANNNNFLAFFLKLQEGWIHFMLWVQELHYVTKIKCVSPYKTTRVFKYLLINGLKHNEMNI